ncbi:MULTISPECIES: IclR family transcriptional regulator [Pseudovibrio]|uniref:IclR family transcriptional regulator n=1 Tax=Stappiaceae TaxID=2821832 RepID=UPI002366C163|nr:MULTISPECIES: IclR family transcriptional regulator [Pseudovibrio]MDD7911416.1 IclR family transcriptional regulator [Pseudovibrio exalbescens]MDX5592897.1 IclR family transcriptional regulator [Pseudovibrio sp. SPO723]
MTMKNIEPDTQVPQEVDLSSPISKALAVLDAVAAADHPPRFVELLSSVPLSRATLHRMLRQLTNEGMLSYDSEQHTYRVGFRLMRLAHSAWANTSLAGAASDALDILSAKVSETIHLAVLDNYQVLYVDKRLPARSVQMYSSPGKIGPAYCTGVGKAMLAFLPDAQLDHAIAAQSFQKHTAKTLVTPQMLRDNLSVIRQRGYAFDDEEHEPTIICIAVPILGRRGEPIGAMSITSTTGITNLDQMVATYLAPLQETARQIAHSAEISMNL